jgi:hypothetical protein
MAAIKTGTIFVVLAFKVYPPSSILEGLTGEAVCVVVDCPPLPEALNENPVQGSSVT